jgi:hypothetical protein
LGFKNGSACLEFFIKIKPWTKKCPKYQLTVRAIITHGLYNLNPLFEGQKRFFRLMAADKPCPQLQPTLVPSTYEDYRGRPSTATNSNVAHPLLWLLAIFVVRSHSMQIISSYMYLLYIIHTARFEIAIRSLSILDTTK